MANIGNDGFNKVDKNYYRLSIRKHFMTFIHAFLNKLYNTALFCILKF